MPQSLNSSFFRLHPASRTNGDRPCESPGPCLPSPQPHGGNHFQMLKSETPTHPAPSDSVLSCPHCTPRGQLRASEVCTALGAQGSQPSSFPIPGGLRPRRLHVQAQMSLPREVPPLHPEARPPGATLSSPPASRPPALCRAWPSVPGLEHGAGHLRTVPSHASVPPRGTVLPSLKAPSQATPLRLRRPRSRGSTRWGQPRLLISDTTGRHCRPTAAS